ncbi:MAG: flagellar motor switch protein FliM [Armatimonadota bacterium]
MSDLLSQDEINALLSAFASGEADISYQGSRHREVKQYDFARPDKFSKEQLRTLQMIHSTYARMLSTTLSTYLRCPFQADLISVDQVTYDEFLKSIPHTTVIVNFSMEPLSGNALLEVNLDVAFSIVDRLMGGTGVLLKQARELTELEQTLMSRVVDHCLSSYADAWSSLVQIRPRVEAISSSTLFTQIALRNDMVMLVTIEARIGTTVGTISVCVPIVVLEPILARLSVQEYFSRQRQEPDVSSATYLRTTVSQIELPCVAVLGRADILVRDWLDLQLGDMIVLDTKVNEDVTIWVGSRPRFRGKPGLSGSHRGVCITGVLEPLGNQEKNKP